MSATFWASCKSMIDCSFLDFDLKTDFKVFFTFNQLLHLLLICNLLLFFDIQIFSDHFPSLKSSIHGINIKKLSFEPNVLFSIWVSPFTCTCSNSFLQIFLLSQVSLSWILIRVIFNSDVFVFHKLVYQLWLIFVHFSSDIDHGFNLSHLAFHHCRGFLQKGFECINHCFVLRTLVSILFFVNLENCSIFFKNFIWSLSWHIAQSFINFASSSRENLELFRL